MKRLISAIKFDMTFQFRHGFYYVYLIISALYVVLLRSLPDEIKQPVATIIILSDPSVLGFFFIGGIIMLEKIQNTLEGVFITPLRVWEYLLAKTLSLTALGLASSFAVVVFSFGISFNPLPLFAGVFLSSVFFTLIGIMVAARVKTVNQYIIIGSLYVTVLFLPIFGYVGIFKTPLYYIMPAQPPLMLIDGAFKGVDVLQWVYTIPMLLLSIAVAFALAYRWFCKYVILRVGGNGE